MRNLFNFDGPVLQFIHKIVYSVYLNILWFLCCIPIVTVGASTTALFYVTLKMSKNEEGNITKAFFHSFRENLKQGTLIWLILLALGILLGIDGYVLYVQKRTVYRSPFSVLHRIDGSHLLWDAAGCSPHLYPGYYFWRRILCVILLVSAV